MLLAYFNTAVVWMVSILPLISSSPSSVSWGNRIRRLHLCRGIKKNNTTTGPPVCRGWRPVMLKDGILVSKQSITCNTPPQPLLELDGRSKSPPRSLGWSRQALARMIVPTLLLLQQTLNPFKNMCQKAVAEGLSVLCMTLNCI